MMLLAPQDPVSENVVGIVGILSVFVFFPLAVAFARLLWKKASNPEPRSLHDPDTARRLAELQQSMDAMALEIERISENQRFVTKLMSEAPAGSLPSGRTGKAAK